MTAPITQSKRLVPARWGDALLTAGAVLGVVCILLTVSGFAFGIRPLVFRSGSMAPEIPTGSLGLADNVDASSLRVGDIVSVESASGTRVTHRVYAINRTGTAYELTLKGDGNEQPDAQTYVVSNVDRVFFHVPLVGYVVGAAGGGLGLLMVGALSGLLLMMVVRPRRRDARHRSLRVVAGAVPVLLLVGLVPPAWATFTDNATMTAGPFTATTVVPPASASCTSALLSATVSWPNPAPGYDYEVVLRRISNSAVVSTRQVTGAATSVTYTGLTDFGLVVGAGTVDFNVEIRSRLTAAPTWTSATVRTYSLIRVLAVAVGATVTCVTV